MPFSRSTMGHEMRKMRELTIPVWHIPSSASLARGRPLRPPPVGDAVSVNLTLERPDAGDLTTAAAQVLAGGREAASLSRRGSGYVANDRSRALRCSSMQKGSRVESE